MESLAGLPLEPVEGPVLCRSVRRVRGRVRVRRAEDVPAVLAACGERGWPLHPISGGKNWGMGSYLPNADDCVILDLGNLKAIGPIDRVAGTVRIEAGVTQLELYQWLQREAPELALNVTGAGKDTSLVGNAMERGIGYAGSRADEFFGHEVVLADGSWHRPDPEWFSTTGSIPAGPRIDALWSQSNYGIVTAAWMKLRRKQAVEAAVIITGDFEPVFETVRQAYLNKLFDQPVHMAGNNRAGRVSAGLLQQLWGRTPTEAEVKAIFPLVQGHTAIAAVHGTGRVVRATLGELRRLARPGVKVRAVTASQLDGAQRLFACLGLRNKATFLAAIRPLLALTWGEPTDAGLASLDLPVGELDPDRAPDGCIYFNAVSGATVQASVATEQMIVEKIRDHSLTRVFMGVGALVHVFSAHFSPDQARHNREVVYELATDLRRRGVPPYRLGQQTMVVLNRVDLMRYETTSGRLAPNHYAP